MTLLIMKVVSEAQGLSKHILWTALVAGLILWLLGSWGHRFWIVLFTTVMAGIAGLLLGQQIGIQPLVGGLLMGVAAGALALSLIRMFMFVVVGLLVGAVIRAVVPTWDDPLITFVGGGMLGVMLSRFWMAVVTSLIGTLVMAHAGLALLANIPKWKVIAWCESHGPVINWAVGATCVLGVMVQYLIQKYFKAWFGGSKDEGAKKEEKKSKKAA